MMNNKYYIQFKVESWMHVFHTAISVSVSVNGVHIFAKIYLESVGLIQVCPMTGPFENSNEPLHSI